MAGRAHPLRIGLAVALAALVAVAFAPAFSAEFLNYDDDLLFLANQRWRGLDTDHVGWMLTTGLMGHWQPLTWLSFGVDYTLHGLTAPALPEAGAYHATNVVLHALTVLAFYWLALRLFALALPDVDDVRRTLAAAGAAALWALSPLRVESVVWLTERRDVLSALFAVLSVRFWLDWAEPGRVDARARGLTLATVACAVVAAIAALVAVDLSVPGELRVASWALVGLAAVTWVASIVAATWGTLRAPAFALACACLVLSLGAKAWAIVLPALLLVLDAWPLRRVARGRVLALVVEKLPLVVPALAVARIAHWAQASSVGVMKTWEQHGLDARAAQALYGLAYYPVRSLLPIDLLPIYELPRQMSLAEPRWLVPALAVVAAAAGVLALMRRAPALAVACLSYAILVSPVLGLVQSGPQLVADRYAHLAMMPLVLLAAGAAARLSRTRGLAVGVVGLGLIVTSAVATWRYAIVWQTSTALWEHAYAVAPENAAVLNSLGTLRSKAAEREADPARALTLLREAAWLQQQAFTHGNEPLTLRNLSQVHGLMSLYDKPNARQHQAEAVDFSRRALELARQQGNATPDYALSYGTDLVNIGKLDEGIEHLRWYVGVEPNRVRGLINLGGALTMAGRGADALPFLQRACSLEPTNPQTWVGLARAQQAIGARDAALGSWRRALALAPHDAGIAQQVKALEAAG